MKNKTIGIYLITEKETGRDVYVGQGDVYGRWKAHRKNYPEELFEYRILLECPRIDLNFWEQHYIRVLKTHWSEGGNNQTWGGQFWPRPEEPLSPATRKKQSEAMKAYEASMTPEAKLFRSQKRSEATKAYEASLSEEEKQKRSEANRVRHASMTEEEKREHSEATKAGIAATTPEKKRKRSQNTSEANRVRHASMTEEEKRKRSEALKAGLANMSEEAKQKRSEAMKAALARKRAAKAAAIAALGELLAS